jgi:hypothetical protein
MIIVNSEKKSIFPERSDLLSPHLTHFRRRVPHSSSSSKGILLTHQRFLDYESEDEIDPLTTFPLVTLSTEDIYLTIHFQGEDRPEKITLITSNQDSVGKSLVWSPFPLLVSAETSIVSRKDW